MTDDLPPGTADYEAITPDPEADPTSLGHHDRRALIWRAIRRAGSPSAVNQRQLAEHFDVAPSTISLDFDRIAQYVRATLGDDIELRGRAVFEHAVDEALERGDTAEAWAITSDWLDFLHRAGAREKPADRVDATIEHSGSVSTPEYQLVEVELADGGGDPFDDEWVFIDDEGNVSTSKGRTGTATVEHDEP